MKLNKSLKTLSVAASLSICSIPLISCDSSGDTDTTSSSAAYLPSSLTGLNQIVFQDESSALHVLNMASATTLLYTVPSTGFSASYSYSYEESTSNYTIRLYPSVSTAFTVSTLNTEIDDASSAVAAAVDNFSDPVSAPQIEEFITAAELIGTEINAIGYDESLNMYLETSVAFVIPVDDRFAVDFESTGDGFTASTSEGVILSGNIITNNSDDELTYVGYN